MTRSTIACTLLATLLGLGFGGSALAASTSPPTDPFNLQGAAPSALTPRSAVYESEVGRRPTNRLHVSSQDIERQDFGRLSRR